jgi:hypothetical protein
MAYHVVKYTGPFGYIKPWTAVRDGETYSQQFLTPSIVEGMRQKLGCIGSIIGHRLQYAGLDMQQEQTRPRYFKKFGENFSILMRGVMLSPSLFLAFEQSDDAARAFRQHICLCRNEDILLPIENRTIDQTEWDSIPGFELIFGQNDNAFLVGFNRFAQTNGTPEPMYGSLNVVGNPIQIGELI